MASGSWNAVTNVSTSSRSFSSPGSSGSGESWRELPVVRPVPIVSTDWVGDDACWELGEMDELLMAEGGIMTSWVSRLRSVLTWLGRRRCA